MMQTISVSPSIIAEILQMAAEIREGKVVINTIVDGFVDHDENNEFPCHVILVTISASVSG